MVLRHPKNPNRNWRRTSCNSTAAVSSPLPPRNTTPASSLASVSPLSSAARVPPRALATCCPLWQTHALSAPLSRSTPPVCLPLWSLDSQLPPPPPLPLPPATQLQHSCNSPQQQPDCSSASASEICALPEKCRVGMSRSGGGLPRSWGGGEPLLQPDSSSACAGAAQLQQPQRGVRQLQHAMRQLHHGSSSRDAPATQLQHAAATQLQHVAAPPPAAAAQLLLQQRGGSSSRNITIIATTNISSSSSSSSSSWGVSRCDGEGGTAILPPPPRQHKCMHPMGCERFANFGGPGDVRSFCRAHKSSNHTYLRRSCQVSQALLILCSCFAHAVRILYSYVTHTLRNAYCTHTLLILDSSFTHT